jgi:teichuronic acid biosynthesis glycosyltransferase TuaC
MRVLIVTAMYPTPENPAFGSFIRTQVEALKEAGVDIELLVLSGKPRKLIYPKGVFQLHHRLASQSIDLIHAHYSYVGMVARLQWQVPLVVTYHGSDLLGAVINEKGEHSRMSNIIVTAGQWLARTVDAAIVQSQEMAQKLAGAEHVYIVPHEVDFERFRPVDRAQARELLQLDPKKKYLLFAANPAIWVKNFPFAKAVADRIIAQDENVELLVVYREPQERLALYMNACDALIFPSFHEGSPNIIKQAMACNLPIVASPAGDVREVIGHTDGCFVCPLELDAFVTKLREVLDRGERTQGRDHIRHFERPLVAQRVINVYEEALRRHRERRYRINHQPS